MENVNLSKVNRSVFSFWPFLFCLAPFVGVYVAGALGNVDALGRGTNESIALPLTSLSLVGYGLLAWRKRNEFGLVMCVLSLGFFCREWHFAGTSNGIYVVLAIVAGWFVWRRKEISLLIKNTPVEIWLWAAFMCYVLAQLIARRVFGDKYLGLLPREGEYHIQFEESMETMAHVMLFLTCLVSWKLFSAKKLKA